MTWYFAFTLNHKVKHDEICVRILIWSVYVIPGTFAYAGAQFGTVISLPISGALAASAAGWPSIFYFFGALGILWSICFFFLGADSPSKHRSISQEERVYIEESLRTTEKLENSKDKQVGINSESHDTFMCDDPISFLETTNPLEGDLHLIAHVGPHYRPLWPKLGILDSFDRDAYLHEESVELWHRRGEYISRVIIFFFRKLFKSCLIFASQSGGYSALPYLAMWLLSFPTSWLSDFALEKGMSRALVRKISNTIAFWSPAVALACMSTVPTDNPTYALILLIIAVGLNAGSLCGFQVNHIDLSPNYAGNMMSITNCMASVIAIIAPLISEAILVDEVILKHTTY